MKIYHNPRCSKSRETLLIIEEKGADVEIVKYMDDALTPDELTDIIAMLGIQPMDLIRKTERVWKEEFKDKELINEELVLAMIEYPQLMERPIVVKGKKAVLGRPPENVNELL